MEKEKFNWKRFSITLVIVLVTAGAVGGSVWWTMNEANKENEDNIKNLQSQIDKMNEKDDEETATEDDETETDETANWKTYKNDDYGFTLTFNDKWENWRVYPKEIDTEYVEHIAFQVPASDWPGGYNGMFNLTVMTPAQWQEIDSPNYCLQFSDATDCPKPRYIDKDKKYVYTYEMNSSDSQNDNGINYSDIELIIKTFEFTN